MALWCPLYVNQEQIGWFGARRTDCGDSGDFTYAAEVAVGDVRWHGEVAHDNGLGAIALMRKVLQAAEDVMPSGA